MLKVDLHIHTADDPQDIVPYSTVELIDRAAALGFGAIAVTLHDRQLELSPLVAYARGRGVELIGGIERSICGKHVLLLNFPAAASESVASFHDLAALRAGHPAGLVIAPHPFYPAPTCLRGLMERHADLFDAVEINAFYTRGFDCNGAARRWGRRHGKPAVGNSDAHRLPLFGRTFSLVGSRPDADAICAAIRAGRVEVRTTPLSMGEAAGYLARLMLGSLDGRRCGRDPLPA